MSRAYLGDQLGRDEGSDDEVDFAPEGDEPKLNCWIDAECKTPEGDEAIHYMLVDGAYVRDHLFIDFCEGGHFYRYGWCPEDQIWIEDIMGVIDQICTGVHEIHERFRMKYKGWDYDRAHDSACVIERKLRRMLLEAEVVVPHTSDLAEIFSLEGSGEDCARAFQRAVSANVAYVEAANEQANNAVGSREG